MRNDDPRGRRYGASEDRPSGYDRERHGGERMERHYGERGGHRGGSPYFDEAQGTGRYERGGQSGADREYGTGGDYRRMSSSDDDFAGAGDRYSRGHGYGGHGGYGEYGRNEGADFERAGRSEWGGYEGNDFRSPQRGRERERERGQSSISQYGGGYGDYRHGRGGQGGSANPSRQGGGSGGMRDEQMAQQGGYEWGDDFGASGGPEPDWYRGAGRYDMGSGRQTSPNWGRSDMQRRMPKNYQRTDERIHEDVCEQLSRSGLDVSEVSVNVSGGHVTLEGTVPARHIKHAIENCVDDCSGVQDIDNRIRVQRESSMGGSASRGGQTGNEQAGNRSAKEKGGE